MKLPWHCLRADFRANHVRSDRTAADVLYKQEKPVPCWFPEPGKRVRPWWSWSRLLVSGSPWKWFRVSSCGKRMIAAYAGLQVSDRESPDIDCESISCQWEIASGVSDSERMCSACGSCKQKKTSWVCRFESLAVVTRAWSMTGSCMPSLKSYPGENHLRVNRVMSWNQELTFALTHRRSQILNWISHNPGLSLVFICVAHILECIPRQRVSEY